MNFYKPKLWIEKSLGSRIALGISRVMGRVADIPMPGSVMKPVVRLYSMGMGVDTDEAPPPEDASFPFNRFFGRHIDPAARPIDPVANALVCPSDGQIVAMGRVENKDTAFTIKDSRYTLQSLLGDEAPMKDYLSGQYAVIYLHPRDYHRVHVPYDMNLTYTRHIPGSRFPVTAWCEKFVDNIYDKNERMVFGFDLPSGGSLAVVMVAAFGVGNIETRFDPGIDKRTAVSRERSFEPTVALRKGEDLGAFLLGSTVVLIGSNGVLELDERLEWGPIKMGQKIGKVLDSNK